MSKSLITELCTKCDGAAALFAATGAPMDGQGLNKVINMILALLETNATSTQLAHREDWLLLVRAISAEINFILGNESRADDAVLLASPMPATHYEQPYGALIEIWNVKCHKKYLASGSLDALLARVVTTAARQKKKLTASIAYGFHQLYGQRVRPTSNSWGVIAKASQIDQKQIHEWLDLDLTDVTRQFLLDIDAYLSQPQLPPQLLNKPNNGSALNGQVDSSNPDCSKKRVRTNEKPPTKGSAVAQDDEPKEPTTYPWPTIDRFLFAAMQAPLIEKAGIQHQWNALSVGCLASITSQCSRLIQGSAERQKAFAEIAIFSLLLRANAKKTVHTLLNLTERDLAEGDYESAIWLDLNSSCLCWLRSSYTYQDQSLEACLERDKEGPLVVYKIPMPELLASAIANRCQKHQGPKSLIDLYPELLTSESQFPFKEYNKFLLELGDKAHAAEPTRFANSLGLAYLSETGSDMAAAMCAFHFEMAAPSALFYFSPRNSWIQEQCARVYQRLGLGCAVEMQCVNRRVGSPFHLQLPELRAGWTSLCDDIVRHYKKLRQWLSNEAGILAFNDLMKAICLGITVANGGRGTAPERLSVAAMMAHPLAMCMADKLTEGYLSKRISAKSEEARLLLAIATSAIKILQSRLSNGTVPTRTGDMLQFFTADISPPSDSKSKRCSHFNEVPIETAQLRVLAQKYFKSELNFARHTWITELGECHVDRWLIRAFSGHGGWLTRSFSYTMAVPPQEAISELESTLALVQGPWLKQGTKVLRSIKLHNQSPGLCFSVAMAKADIDSALGLLGTHRGRSDPLEPIDEQCLIDWNLVEQIRTKLVQAPPTLADGATYLLSTLVFDGLPTLDHSIKALQPDNRRVVEQLAGHVWNRDHFVHPVWTEIQAPTLIYLSAINGKSPDVDQCIASAAGWIRQQTGFFGWLTEDEHTLDRLALACQRWRRFELAPNLLAMASLKLETAVASAYSLCRVGAGPSLRMISIPSDLPSQPESTLWKNHDLSRLTTLINQYSAGGNDLGRQVERANGLIGELEGLRGLGTSVFDFAIDYLVSELKETVRRAGKRTKTSSFATRWASLHQSLDNLSLDEDIESWEGETWISFCDDVNLRCISARRSTKLSDNDSEADLANSGWHRRAKVSLIHCLRALCRSGWTIPSSVFHHLNSAELRFSRDSASSTLITTGDKQQIRERVLIPFSDHPDVLSRFDGKLAIADAVPTRLGEVSSLPHACLTQDNHLVFPATKFATDKSGHSIRTCPVSEQAAQRIRSAIENKSKLKPQSSNLFKFDDRSRAWDQLFNARLSQAYKAVSGAPSARPHSGRASTYMYLLWPGWCSVLQQFFSGELYPDDCKAWLRDGSISVRWLGSIEAATMSGHGAVDPGYTSYASLWPQIYSIALCASLSRLKPGKSLLQLAELTDSAFRKAKQRAKAHGGERELSLWVWISKRFKPLGLKPFYEERVADHVDPNRHGINPAARRAGGQHTSLAPSVKYLCLLLAGLDRPTARHLCCLSAVQEQVLLDGLPSSKVKQQATKRVRSPHSDRGSLAVQELIQSDDWLELARWIAKLPSVYLDLLTKLLMRTKGKNGVCIEQAQCPAFWSSISEDMPSAFSFKLRFGVGPYLDPGNEFSIKERLAPSVQIRKRHKRSGRIPQVALTHRSVENKVDEGRLTAVLRITCIAMQIANGTYVDGKAKDEGNNKLR